MTTTKLAQVLVCVVLGASLAASCGGAGPLATDGGAGHGGTTGSAGHGGAGEGGSSGGGVGGLDGGVAGTSGGYPGTDPAPACSYGLARAECEAMSACAFFQGPSCNGEPGVTFCYPKGSAVDYFCPPPPPACSTLDEAACSARTDCRVDHCPACSGGSLALCARLTDPPSTCPHCVVPCSQVTVLEDCEVRTDCHAVYQDPGTCACAEPGCCAKFSFCADGNSAKCSGNPVCKSAAPHCEGIFVVSYTDTCYEGCVEQADCTAYPP